ncbi:MAG: DUF502 domain-containing protein [Saprospiraceae bacterium]|nr:DUF502 domain-containing protein [Saprospiraceae bacterium]MCB0626989.1 DUF502 domain-containing protein [Saprospiraceae bacterium]MCB0678817.1 DUF502 domain-containing protein [Saprospiraceae bacterium]MCB0683318.1 DUF502 domain-containing protein [Saprospiraceae bacterium]
MLKRVNNFFRTTLIGGMLVLLPITIFVWLVKLIFDFILRIIRPLTNILDFGQITNELLLSLIAIGIIILFCFLVGLFVRTRSGKAIFGYFDRELLNRLPFYNTIKETVQQFTGAKKGPFSQVILVDAFGNGTRMLGFISAEHADKRYTVFVPTTPNPTNGFLFNVEESQIEFLDVGTEEAMRVIIGVGTGAGSLFYRKSEQTITDPSDQ